MYECTNWCFYIWNFDNFEESPNCRAALAARALYSVQWKAALQCHFAFSGPPVFKDNVALAGLEPLSELAMETLMEDFETQVSHSVPCFLFGFLTVGNCAPKLRAKLQDYF